MTPAVLSTTGLGRPVAVAPDRARWRAAAVLAGLLAVLPPALAESPPAVGGPYRVPLLAMDPDAVQSFEAEAPPWSSATAPRTGADLTAADLVWPTLELDLTATGSTWSLLSGEAAPAEAATEPEPSYPFPQPYQLIRRVLWMQERTAHGDAAAYQTVPAALEAFGLALKGMPPQIWKDARNARAVAAYMMAGGAAEPVKALLAAGVTLDLPEGLLDGLFASADGRYEDARADLAEVPMAGLPPLFAGQLALARATLSALAEVDEGAPLDAAALYDTARLSVPGSLIEEAALRHGAIHAGRQQRYDRFRVLAQLYIRRFGGSLFFGEFQQQAAVIVLQLDTNAVESHLDEIGGVTLGFDPVFRRDLYLLLSRRALIAGNIGIARAAGDVALDLVGEDPPSRARALLYHGAALMLSGTMDAARRSLEAVDMDVLPTRDHDLRAAVLALSVPLFSHKDAGHDGDTALLAAAHARMKHADPFHSAVPDRLAAAVTAATDTLKEARDGR
ncbi:hypothetical protein [Mongoliimonas terrestris]|uniref:hypothetical protein n=1 Tax=Mongoliimonas terrestris TaxID=1709001 RepID=UPI0009495D26|nr:hypothetical protein [Mongoliimonas terrestris]